MSDAATVVLAVAAVAGAWVGRPFPVAVAALVTVAGLALRRPAVLCVGVALATSGLAARSWAGLHPPVTGHWSGVATLVTDPAPAWGAQRAIARVGAKRVEVGARGAEGRILAQRLAGERVWLSGTVEALPPVVRDRLAFRHVAARMSVQEVGDSTPGSLPSQWANSIRRTLLAGTSSLSPDRRALFAGFVLGDDRDHTPEVTDDFRASGLTHLLVVSGGNVAFVLGLFAPLLRRLGFRGRLVVGLAVLGLFGILTRWEPSVLRAEAMAALALMASVVGRPASGLRLLALAVTGLLLIDPLLVTSLGFGLSVAASAGIAVLAKPVTRAIPGPRPLASALGVSVAAQAGVAPLLVPAFGSVPVATFPANLLAIPAAGPLVAWGMAAGLPAGMAGGAVAHLVHLPTGLLVGWVATVARHAANAPLGRLRVTHLVVLAAAVVAAGLLTRHPRRWMAVAVAGVGLSAAVPALAPGPLDGHQVSPGARLWRRGGATVLVVDGARSPTALLAGLHEAEVARLDVVVVCGKGRGPAGVVGPLLRRFSPRLLLAPSGSPVAGATVPEVGAAVDVGALNIRVDAVTPELAVTVGASAAPRAPPR